jgi:geranylgeranyl diphosphate synthase type I
VAAPAASDHEVDLNTHQTRSPSIAPVGCAVERLVRQKVRSGQLQELVLEFLHQAGRVLNPHLGSKWPRYVLLFASALGADPADAVEAAAAVEFAVAGIDLVDNIIDDEVGCASPGVQARATNASLVPIALAFTSVLVAQEALGADRARDIAEIISKGTLECCVGQDDDLRLARTLRVTEGEALAMTGHKSGALVGMACEVGAAVASKDQAVLDVAHDFGVHCGIVAQLLNDLVAIDPEVRQRGSDLRLRKKTLPVAYALECARQEGVHAILDWFDRPDENQQLDETQIAQYMQQVGAAHFAWVVADSHRLEAFAALRRLQSLTGAMDPRPLRSVVPRVSPRFK